MVLESEMGPAERYVTIPAGLPQYTLGWEAIRWGIKYLRQPDGDNSGDRWHFTDSQIKFLLWWYALDSNGKWLYTHGVRRLPKGAGKSPFAAVISLIELCAPVRFKRWMPDPKNPDEKIPIGKPVGMPLVQIAATAQDQGQINTMMMVTALIVATKSDGTVAHGEKSRLIKDYGLEVGKTQINKPGGGFLHVITSSASSAEGARTTFGICDQTEAWVQANGGHKLFQVMDRNAAKSKSRLVQTANAWAPGEDSVAERTMDDWVKEQEGRTLGKAKTLMDVRMAPPETVTYIGNKDDRIIDREALVRGVQFAYGDCYWVDAEDIVDNHVLDLKTPFDVSKRFYLNWPTVSEDAWIEPYQWTRWRDPLLQLLDGSEIALGFDGSRTNDATALIACEISTGNVFDLGIWETYADPANPKVRVPIPVDQVDAAVEKAFKRFNPVAFFADVREWESFSKVEWPKRFGSQLKIWANPGGRDPQPIAWDMRTHVGEFTAAAEMTHEEITGDVQVFAHDGSGILSKHVVQMKARENRWGTSVGKESPLSPKKIDGGVAMIIARQARRLYLASLMEKPDNGKGKKPGVVWGENPGYVEGAETKFVNIDGEIWTDNGDGTFSKIQNVPDLSALRKKS